MMMRIHVADRNTVVLDFFDLSIELPFNTANQIRGKRRASDGICLEASIVSEKRRKRRYFTQRFEFGNVEVNSERMFREIPRRFLC